MKFPFRRSKPTNELFGIPDEPPAWNLPENGDDELETMILGAETGTPKWASLRSPVLTGRLRAGLLIVLLCFGLLIGRSAYLQVMNGNYYRTMADANSTRINILPAHRGVIKDRNGQELAKNSPSFLLIVWPQDLPEDETEKQTLINEVAAEIAVSPTALTQVVANAPDDKLSLIVEDINYERALAFMAHQDDFPGFKVEFAERRQYFTNAIPTLSHVLGYTGPVSPEEYETLAAQGYRQFDSIGKQGLEAWYEDYLRGEYGQEVIEVDSRGHSIRVVSRREPVGGQDLNLTLDARLQAYIEVVLENRLANAPTKRAAVVVMEPNTGEVLALVSTPGFDANAFTSGISSEDYDALLNDPNKPLFPRAYAGEYPAGSTIKPTFASAALMSGLITPQTTFFSSGGLMLGDRFFPDWRPGGHGVTNVYHAIADSVNTFFYMIGGGNESFPGMGLDKLMAAALSFGYGQKSGLDVTGEADGFLPSKDWKQDVKGEPWYIGDTYNVSIGQGDLLVTPLQVARATAVIANGGELVTPQLVSNDSAPRQRVISDEVDQVVRDAMRQTVTAGSARSLQSVPVPVAGKTGTAQWSHSEPAHSWFTGFAPYDKPEIVITVLIEQGGNDTAAVPVANDILKWYFSNR